MRQNTKQLAAVGAFTAMFWASAAAAQTPNLSGMWLPVGGGQQGGKMTQWSKADPAFTPDGLARFNANKPGKGPRMAPPAFGNDPLGNANPPGLLRTLVYMRTIDNIQLPDRIVQLFEYGHFWRTIWTDGRAVPDDQGPFWYGYSVGRWEGDTLVVTTVGLDGRAWLDEWGTPFTDEAKITERWRRIDANTIQMTITVDDPPTFSKPWTSDPRTFRFQARGTPNGEMPEVIFAPIDEQAFNEKIRNPAGGRVN